jgi:hypothetical protein
MNSVNVDVVDYPYLRQNNINNIKLRINSFELFKKITIFVSLYENSDLIDNKLINISDEEYANWGTDDKYIIDLVLSKLGLTEKVIVST